MLLDQCEFVVVEYCRAFPEAEFQPCLVLAGWHDTEEHEAVAEVYRSRRWDLLIQSEHQNYLDSLIEDWIGTGSDSMEIGQVKEQLEHLSVGPIRLGKCGKASRAELDAVLERDLGIVSET